MPAQRLAQKTVFAACSKPCLRWMRALRNPPSENVTRNVESTVPA